MTGRRMPLVDNASARPIMATTAIQIRNRADLLAELRDVIVTSSCRATTHASIEALRLQLCDTSARPELVFVRWMGARSTVGPGQRRAKYHRDTALFRIGAISA